jgi:Fe-S cluster biosynthesis and repair protein YggX
MNHTVYCIKLKKEAEGLKAAPMPGLLGKRLYDEVSKEAWQQWLKHQTLLINEHRLNLLDAKSRQFLRLELEKYFFGEGSEKPMGFVNPF